MVLTANVDHVLTLAENTDFRKAYENAWVVTADGTPLCWYARFIGVSGIERVTGSDLCIAILKKLHSLHRPFFVANSQQTAAEVRARMQELGNGEGSAFFIPPFGFESNSLISEKLISEINRHNTTHLFFCLGAPKSEIWCDRNRDRLGKCYILPFGAGLEYFAGTRRRAPRLLQILAAEWIWRLASEPRRLSARYLRNLLLFSSILVRDLLDSRGRLDDL